NLGHAQFRRQRTCIHRPRQIRRAHVIVDYRTRNAKTRGHDGIRSKVRRGQPRKFLYNQIELREFLARKSLPEYARQRAVLLREQRKITFCSADVTRKNPRCPLLLTSIAGPSATVGGLRVVPTSSAAVEQKVRFPRPPAPRRILWHRRRLRRAPYIQNWLDQRPRRLHAVPAVKQRRIPADAI